MSDPRITDEAVEAAAVAACEFVYPPKTHQPWADVDDWEQDAWRATVRVALEAALQLLAPQPVVDREAVADAIDPEAFEETASEWINLGRSDRRTKALISADAVLALLNGTTP